MVALQQQQLLAAQVHLPCCPICTPSGKLVGAGAPIAHLGRQKHLKLSSNKIRLLSLARAFALAACPSQRPRKQPCNRQNTTGAAWFARLAGECEFPRSQSNWRAVPLASLSRKALRAKKRDTLPSEIRLHDVLAASLGADEHLSKGLVRAQAQGDRRTWRRIDG